MKDRRKLIALIALGIMLLAVRFILWQQSPQTKAAQRIRNAVATAEEPVHKPGSGVADVEKFLADLKAIDQTDAPPEIKAALQHYIAVVESNLALRHSGAKQGEIDASNEQVGDARRAFLRAADQARGEPY
jgi:hypothetical protein